MSELRYPTSSHGSDTDASNYRTGGRVGMTPSFSLFKVCASRQKNQLFHAVKSQPNADPPPDWNIKYAGTHEHSIQRFNLGPVTSMPQGPVPASCWVEHIIGCRLSTRIPKEDSYAVTRPASLRDYFWHRYSEDQSTSGFKIGKLNLGPILTCRRERRAIEEKRIQYPV